MIKKQIIKKAIGVSLAASISFFYSCKEKTMTGTETIPGQDKINTIELGNEFFQPSLKIQTSEKVNTNHMASPKVGIGHVLGDPIFSEVNASAYLQLAPAGAFYNVPADFVLDSAHFILPYSGISYGDTTNISSTAMEVTILPVLSGIQNPKLYEHTQEFETGAAVGTVTTDYEQLKMKYEWENDTIEESLVIPIDNDYLQSILDLPSSEYASSGIFLENVNGFKLKATKINNIGNGMLYYFNLAHSDTKKAARIVAHGQRDGKYHALYFSFLVNQTNYFTHLDKVHSPNPFYNGEKYESNEVFIENGPGLYTEVTLHNLPDVPASIIHKASISLVSLHNSFQNGWGVPKQLIIERVKMQDGEEVVEKVIDYGQYDGLIPLNGLEFVGGQMGLFSIAGVSEARYVLNFPRLLQEVIKEGANSLTLRISVMGDFPGAFRLHAGGIQSADERYDLKVVVVATEIE